MDNKPLTELVIGDISPHAVQLARMVDRLPPGNYEITIQKQDLRQQDWPYEINRTDKISSGNLSSRKYSAE